MYSEQISNKYSLNEYKLIKLLKNVQCKRCGLIYKKNWFDKKTSNEIFNQIVPTHPKGWDVRSKKFNLKFFKKNLNILSKLSTLNKKFEINKINRELISIADSLSVKNKEEENLKKKLIVSIKRFKFKKINHYLNRLKNCFSSPEEFKRFSGFSSICLSRHIKSIVGDINNYSEIGCPLWGSLNIMNKKKKKCSFIIGKPFQFWGQQCKKENLICHNLLNKKIKKYKDFPNLKRKVDYLGAYLYLDHVINPVSFIKKILEYSNSVGFILERSNTGVPVQHFTGWNINSIKYLAKIFKKKINYSFAPIKKTGKDFFLLY